MKRENWVRFTNRTDDPKLAWLEANLASKGIPFRRNGFSWHAPILEVRECDIDAAWEILGPVDDIEDGDPLFQTDVDSACTFGVGDDMPDAASEEAAYYEELNRGYARDRI